MKYLYTAPIYLTRFPGGDISLGLHLCWKGRIDLHIGVWMLSIGNVPIYQDRDHKSIAVSNSFHKWATRKRPVEQRPALRAGVPM